MISWIISKTQLYTMFKRLISHAMTPKPHRKGMEKNSIKQMEKTKAGVAILISDKTDFKPARIKRTKKGIT